jgi:hypothetical protein
MMNVEFGMSNGITLYQILFQFHIPHSTFIITL